MKETAGLLGALSKGQAAIRLWTWGSAHKETRHCSMATRQSELERILGLLSQELPDPDWVALVDEQGLVLSCVPDEPVVSEDRISAMTAAMVDLGDRVVREVEGGTFRFATVSGSQRQHLAVLLTSDRLLSVGLNPRVPAQATFAALSRRVPDVLKTLKASFG